MKDAKIIDFLKNDLKIEQIDFFEKPEVYEIKGKGIQSITFCFRKNICRVQRSAFSVVWICGENLLLTYEIPIENYKSFLTEEYNAAYYSVLHKKDGIIQCETIRKTASEQTVFEKEVFKLFNVVSLKKDTLNDMRILYEDPTVKIDCKKIQEYYFDILMQNFGNHLNTKHPWNKEDRIIFDCPKRSAPSDTAVGVLLSFEDDANLENYESTVYIQMFGGDEEIGFFMLSNQVFERILNYMKERMALPKPSGAE